MPTSNANDPRRPIIAFAGFVPGLRQPNPTQGERRLNEFSELRGSPRLAEGNAPMPSAPSSGSRKANPRAEDSHGWNSGPEASPRAIPATSCSTSPPSPEASPAGARTLHAAAGEAEGELAVSLTVRECRALWRFASMFDVAARGLAGTHGPCEIDLALCKLELALMLAGERAE